MSATWTDIPAIPRAATLPAQMTRPKPQPLVTPVLIGDCASPLADETVLSLLWKRLDAECDQ